MPRVECGDFLELQYAWPDPTVIICDGPYGVPMVKDEPKSIDALPSWYAPHLDMITKRSTPETTLWFWGTELSWATVHPEIVKRGWVYRACNIWNKGVGHIAGHVNTQTIRTFPIVTEVCVQYAREPFIVVNGEEVQVRNWLRAEWMRAGLPLNRANEACGVSNAATRKYLASDNEWYMPPDDMFAKLVEYANLHGDPEGRPYFKLPQGMSTSRDRSIHRNKFYCEYGVTNVWEERPVRGAERVKVDGKAVHPQQKPLALIERIIEASSDPGDVVWEPFGGMCTVAVASKQLGRDCYSAEIDKEFYAHAMKRIMDHGT